MKGKTGITKFMASMVGCLVLVLGSMSSVVYALPYGGDPSSLQTVLDNITTTGPSSVNVDTDYLPDAYDSYWDITGSGGSLATFIIEIAGYANVNTFGVFNGGQKVELFDGSATTGSQVSVSIALDGSVFKNFVDTGIDFSGTTFGYYIDSGSGDTWYSDSTKNTDLSDHMLAYQGTGDTVQIGSWAPGTWTSNEYVLAFEDLPAGSADWDYDDLVVMVESVEPIPEPATIMLLGAGLAGLGGWVRRRQNKKS